MYDHRVTRGSSTPPQLVYKAFILFLSRSISSETPHPHTTKRLRQYNHPSISSQSSSQIYSRQNALHNPPPPPHLGPQENLQHLIQQPGISRLFTVCLYPPTSLDRDDKRLKYNLNNFDPPEQLETQHDPVLHLIIRTINQLKAQDIAIAGANIKVWSMTNSPPLWPRPRDRSPRSTSVPEIKFYAFKEWYEEFPATVPVRIACPGAKRLRPGNVLVKGHGYTKWTPLRTWLLNFPDREMVLEPGEWADVAQRAWWYYNGKYFALMDLPKELRLAVLRHVVGGPRISLGVHTDRNKQQRVNTGDAANYEIFRVSRQVRAEALEAGYIGTVKSFEEPETFRDVVRCPNPPPFPTWLNKIELNFSISGFFSFFGAYLDQTIEVEEARSMGPLLWDISTLKELRIVFRNAYEFPEKDRNPWDEYCSANYNKAWFQPIKDMVRRRVCWRVMAQWIMTLAFPYVKHIPIVRLEGCVKTDVKRAWEMILREEYKLRGDVEAQQTHGYDWDQEMRTIQSCSFMGAPVCFCPLPCDEMEMWRRGIRDSIRQILSGGGEVLRFDRDDEFTMERYQRALRLVKKHGWLHPIIYGPDANLKELEAEYLGSETQDDAGESTDGEEHVGTEEEE